MPINAHNPFKGRQFPGEVIVLCVRWYLRYPLSYEHVAELVAERGVEVDASCIWRWVQAYAPELNKRCRPHLKPTNKSYRIDETYINVKGENKYLYRALDSTGQTIDFLRTAKRDTAAAKRFLRKAIDASGNPMPRVKNVDKNPAYPAAVEGLKADGTIPRRVALRQCKYLNNVIEQDHRTVKKRVWLAKGYGSFQSAWRTLQGIETVNMIRKGRVRWLAKGDAVGQAHFIGKLFALKCYSPLPAAVASARIVSQICWPNTYPSPASFVRLSEKSTSLRTCSGTQWPWGCCRPVSIGQ